MKQPRRQRMQRTEKKGKVLGELFPIRKRDAVTEILYLHCLKSGGFNEAGVQIPLAVSTLEKCPLTRFFRRHVRRPIE